jgi:hypothetical protein
LRDSEDDLKLLIINKYLRHISDIADVINLGNDIEPLVHELCLYRCN